jgi:hypothetical protein
LLLVDDYCNSQHPSRSFDWYLDNVRFLINSPQRNTASRIVLTLVDWLVQLVAHRATIARCRTLPRDFPVLVVPTSAAMLRHRLHS